MRERDGRWRIAAMAVIIVVAQLLALAHSHNTSGPPRLASHTQTAGADACVLCTLAFHAPLSAAPSPAFDYPARGEALAVAARTLIFASGSHPFFLSRAPPAAD